MSSASASSRFTAWLSDDEREKVKTRARQLGTSENHVVRLCIRAALGMQIPDYFLTQAEQTEQTEKEPA